MRSPTSSSSSSRRALASLLILISPVYALNVSTPLADQYPQVAHAGQPYSWTFSPSTFAGDDDAAAPSLAAKGLPSWASFDAASHTFSGTPPADEQDTSKVTVTASSSSSSVSSPFDLVVVTDPQPTLKKSLVDQLPTASSLGRSQILPGTKLHIPWGWSFSVGWQGDTFYLESGNEIYTHATFNGDQPLPQWLKYSSQTYAMWGIAPNVPGPEGTEFVFTLTGTNVEGNFGGTSTNVTIVLGTGNLATTGTLPALNATAGQEVSYAIPLSAFSVDGAPATAQAVNVTADTGALPWLSYDAASRTLKGTPPTAQQGETASLPITVTDSLGKSLNASLAVNLFPPAFSADVLPNVMVVAGQEFNVSLADFVRNSTQHNISITLDPQSASEWVHFNASDLVLSGMPPKMGANDKVKVTLQSAAPSSQQQQLQRRASSSTPSNQASFYIAPQGSKPGPAGSTSTGKGNGGSGGGSGLAQRTKIGLAAGLGTVGAIILLVLLLMFARRCCAVEEHDSHGNVIVPGKSPAFSERTLINDASPNPAMWGQEAEKKEKAAMSPTVVSKSPADLKGILVGGRHYGGGANGGEVSDDAAPRQHGFMSALVAGARRLGSSRSISQQAEQQQPPMQHHRGRSDSQGLGLSGLDLDTPDSDDPYRGATGAAPSRSHLSMRSKESWEEDLFYSSTEAADRGVIGGGMGGALTPVIEVDEVPTRRGGSESSVGGGSHLRVSSRSNPMRHRSGHNKASPSFTTSDTFETPTVDELPQQGGSYDGEDALPVGESSGPYTIGTAQRVDMRSLTRQGSVQSHRPDLRKGHHHSRSTHLDAIGAFEDADDEEGQIVAGRDQRTSTASNVDALTASHLEGLQYIQYPSGVGAASPRPPSFFGGSSIASNVRPEDTMRAVVTPPPQHNPSSPHRRTSSRSGIVEHLEANVSMGERIRIKLTPPGGAAMMGGAPGSPGKRSNRRGKYVPVLDDASMQAHGTWPIWLAEWLHWDPTMFELSGEVPVDFELPELHIALVHRRTGGDLTTTAATPGSGSGSSGSGHHHGGSAPSPRPAHHRQGSQDSAMTVVEDEVVIRLTLFIDWPVDPTGSGNQIALRREGAAGAGAGTAF